MKKAEIIKTLRLQIASSKLSDAFDLLINKINSFEILSNELRNEIILLSLKYNTAKERQNQNDFYSNTLGNELEVIASRLLSIIDVIEDENRQKGKVTFMWRKRETEPGGNIKPVEIYLNDLNKVTLEKGASKTIELDSGKFQISAKWEVKQMSWGIRGIRNWHTYQYKTRNNLELIVNEEDEIIILCGIKSIDRRFYELILELENKIQKSNKY